MNILVTGGAGFIGRWVVKKLLEDNQNVWVLDDLSNGSKENLKEFENIINFKGLFIGDIKSLNDIDNIFINKFDICYHLAASINVQDSIDKPRETFENDVIGTFNILEACKKSNTKVVFMSTCMVYDKSDDKGIDEEHNLKPASPYAGSKIAAENLVLSYWYAYKMPVVIARPFNTYGPFQKTGGEGGVIPIFINKVLDKETLNIYGSGNQTRDFLYVEDCANFVVKCGYNDKANGQIINAGLGEDISINDLAFMICKDKTRIKHIEHIHPQSEIMKLMCNPEKAKDLLDWEAEYTLEEGINKTAKWIKGNKNLTDKNQKVNLSNNRGLFQSNEIILFGTGKMAENFYMSNKNNLKIKFCLDNDNNKQGKTFYDMKIYSPYEKNINIDKYMIVIASMSYPSISIQLQRMGLKEFENFISISLADLIYNKNKKLAIIYGNCHTKIIENYLAEYKYFSNKICFYPMPRIYEYNNLNFNSTSISVLKNCDLFIYQGFQDGSYGKDLASNSILSILKKDCILIKMANVHGHAEAFFPQVVPNKNNAYGLFPHGDKNIDKLVSEKRNLNEIISILREDNIYTQQQISDNLSYQLEALVQRQKGCDIKIVDYIEQNYTKERLFNDLYRPTNFLLKEFARRILKYLNIYNDEFESLEIKQDLSTFKTPIYPSVAKHLKLEYKSDTGRVPYGELYGKELSFNEYIKQYIKYCYGITD